MDSSSDNIKNVINHWWLELLAGLFFLACGVFVLFRPIASYLGLSIFFIVSFIVSGISGLIFSIGNNQHLKGWGWYLVTALLELVFGIILLLNPAISIITLPLYVGFILMVKSMTAIAVSFDLRELMVRDWGWMLALGFLGLFFSFFIIFNPLLGAISIIAWTGVAFIATGIAMIIFSIRIKQLKHA